MTKDEALQLALDCVSTLANARDWVGCTPNERWDEDEMYAELCNATICLKKSLSIIQEALAEQPAQQQEPVAEHFEKMHANGDVWITTIAAAAIARNTSPQSKPWVGLSNDEIYDMYNEPRSDAEMVEFARAIEAKLREKNEHREQE